MRGTNNDKQLSRIVLKGFKSIANCDLQLSRLNILIGANGAGKSNFIGFFRMVQQLLEQNLQVNVSRQGGPDALLHFGRKTTEQLEFQLYFGNNGYFATLEPTQDNRLMFAFESFWSNMSGEHEIGRGHFETKALSDTETLIDSYVIPLNPILVKTSSTGKGGVVSYAKIKSQINRKCRQLPRPMEDGACGKPSLGACSRYAKQ